MEASVRGAGRGAGRMQERKALSVRLRAREVIWALEASAWQVGPFTGGPQGDPPETGLVTSVSVLVWARPLHLP